MPVVGRRTASSPSGWEFPLDEFEAAVVAAGAWTRATDMDAWAGVPGAFTFADFGKGPERVKILRTERADGKGEAGQLINDDLTVACGDGAVRILNLQRAGAKPMSADEFLRGVKPDRTKRLG